METIRRFFEKINAAPFQVALVISFTLIAAITISLGALVTSATVKQYLAEILNMRVTRDAHLASTFYEMKLGEVWGTSQELADNPAVIENLAAARAGDPPAVQAVNSQIALAGSRAFRGNRCLAILDDAGRLLAGQIVSSTGTSSTAIPGAKWTDLPIIRSAMSEARSLGSTEIIPIQYLAGTDLAAQLHVDVFQTPKAARELFDRREGTAGLALVGVTPVMSRDGLVQGAALCFHLFNNDFSLVDQIKEAAMVDTSTIFLGDLRVSTNVRSAEGRRAVGTRLAEEVAEVLLNQGREYVGPAFVVNENYITRYEPLRDHTGPVIGGLYVGTRQSASLRPLHVGTGGVAREAPLTSRLPFVPPTGA
ncbi:MAG: hypothetical protein EHM61_13570, partial [Acidobacteria bacterium]